MTIRKKILGGFISIFIIGLVLGSVGLISTNKLSQLSKEQHTMQEAATSVSSVLSAHYIWRQGLTEAVFTDSEFTGSLDPNTCALGKWKNSEEAKIITDSEILSLLEQINEPHSYIHNDAQNIIAMLKSEDAEGAKKEFLEKVLPKTEETINLLTAMNERYAALLNEKSEDVNDFGKLITTIIVILIALAVIASVFLTWLITASIMKPIRKITRAAETIATGDLDVNVTYTVNDEIGKLVKSFHNMVDSTENQVAVTEILANGDLTVEITPRCEKDKMNFALKHVVDKLNNMLAQISNSTLQVSMGSKQMADGAQTLAQGATEQAATIEQLSASINEIADKTKSNANMAKEASSLAETIKTNAEKGSVQMEQMMLAVKEINDASDSIRKVIKVIEDIAFQTNILALNAAVEAARAGQHGKGFAVVAEEVRSLATKSSEASKNSGSLIENSINKANLGYKIATETASSLKEIVDGVNRSVELVSLIAKSSDEQANAILQINSGVEQVSQVVQQNSATAEESAAASEEMSGQSSILESLIKQFKLKDGYDGREGVMELPPGPKENALSLTLDRENQKY